MGKPDGIIVAGIETARREIGESSRSDNNGNKEKRCRKYYEILKKILSLWFCVFEQRGVKSARTRDLTIMLAYDEVSANGAKSSLRCAKKSDGSQDARTRL